MKKKHIVRYAIAALALLAILFGWRELRSYLSKAEDGNESITNHLDGGTAFDARAVSRTDEKADIPETDDNFVPAAIDAGSASEDTEQPTHIEDLIVCYISFDSVSEIVGEVQAVVIGEIQAYLGVQRLHAGASFTLDYHIYEVKVERS